jgi:hypothetical protein
VIFLENNAARAALPLPGNTHALLTEWASTHCKTGIRGIMLGDVVLTANLAPPAVPTPAEAAAADDAAVKTALLHRAAPFDASGIVAPLRTTSTGHASPFYAHLHATPARAWQFAFLPTLLTARLDALLTRRTGIPRRLKNKLIDGLASVWSARHYQSRLPARILPAASAGAAPENVSKSARVAIAHKWVTGLIVMKKAKGKPADH